MLEQIHDDSKPKQSSAAFDEMHKFFKGPKYLLTFKLPLFLIGAVIYIFYYIAKKVLLHLIRLYFEILTCADSVINAMFNYTALLTIAFPKFIRHWRIECYRKVLQPTGFFIKTRIIPALRLIGLETIWLSGTLNRKIYLLYFSTNKYKHQSITNMPSENGIYCIWLDLHIGIIEEYRAFHEKFQEKLAPINGLPPDSINNLMLCFEQEIAPIKFVSNIDDALVLIQNETEKRIILISSGTLGKDIVPFVTENYPRVYSFYIFCAVISNHCRWALPYSSCLQMFGHETDLLIRLLRDISKEFIHLGRSYLAVDEGESARQYFVTAQTLEIDANNADTIHHTFNERLDLLQGPNGLIRRAKNLRDEHIARETIAFVDEIQYILVDLSESMNPTAECIVHFLKIFLSPQTLITIDNSSSDDIIRLIDKPTCLFTTNNALAELLRERCGSSNLSLYMIEDNADLVDNTTLYGNINDLVDKLVELIVAKYRQQAAKHRNIRKTQLADIEMKMAERIEYEVRKLQASQLS
ncbi:unnamed protein product [Rotaria socialis]